MACPQSGRNVVRFLGWTCLVLGFLPYYSRTTRTASGLEKQIIGIDLPVPGKQVLSKQTEHTTVRLGLPCSPLFLYERVIDSPQAPKVTLLTSQDGSVSVGQGITLSSSGDAPVTTFTSNYKFNMGLHLLSWSMGLVLLGPVLLCAARRCGRPDVATEKPAPEAGVQDDAV